MVCWIIHEDIQSSFSQNPANIYLVKENVGLVFLLLILNIFRPKISDDFWKS